MSDASDFPNAERASIAAARRDNDSVVLVAGAERLGPPGTKPATARYEFRMSEGMASNLLDELAFALKREAPEAGELFYQKVAQQLNNMAEVHRYLQHITTRERGIGIPNEMRAAANRMTEVFQEIDRAHRGYVVATGKPTRELEPWQEREYVKGLLP